MSDERAGKKKKNVRSFPVFPLFCLLDVEQPTQCFRSCIFVLLCCVFLPSPPLPYVESLHPWEVTQPFLSSSLSLISLSGPFLLLHLSFVACTFSGECLDHMEDENMKLLTFPVKVEDGSVFLDLPPTSELDQVHNHMLRSIRIYRVHVMLCFSCFQRVSFFFFEQVYFFRFFSSSLAWYCGRGLDFRQMGY